MKIFAPSRLRVIYFPILAQHGDIFFAFHHAILAYFTLAIDQSSPVFFSVKV